MITAAQARELAGPTLDEKLAAIGKAIEEAAKAKKRKLRTGWEYKEHRELWIDGGYSGSEEWKQAKAHLEKLGYKVSFHYEERQFVDMYTVIEW